MQSNRSNDQVANHLDAVQQNERREMVELDLSVLQAVGGGLAPNDSWATSGGGTTDAPNSTW